MTFGLSCAIIIVEIVKEGVLLAKHIVQCRTCGLKFDATPEAKDIDWVVPTERMYYHKSCYENWKKNMQDPKADMTPKQWYDSAREFLAKDVRMDVDWEKFASQWKTFLRPSYRPEMTPKGIYFAIRYYFDVKHGDKAKAQGGIGIVPYVYAESCQHWALQERRCAGIIAKITEQARAYSEQAHVVVKGKKKENPNKKARFSLDEVEDD